MGLRRVVGGRKKQKRVGRRNGRSIASQRRKIMKIMQNYKLGKEAKEETVEIKTTKNMTQRTM